MFKLAINALEIMYSDKIICEGLNDLSKDKWCASRIKKIINICHTVNPSHHLKCFNIVYGFLSHYKHLFYYSLF